MIKLIGLLGIKGAGKDTAAAYLVSQAGFTRTSFASSLYAEVALAFGVSVEFLLNRDTKEKPLEALKLSRCKDRDFVAIALAIISVETRGLPDTSELEKPRSPRWVLQIWGTEYRRRSRFGYDSYWLDQVAALVQNHPDSRFVITDVRFSNEADWVEGAGGILIRIRRPVLEAEEESARKAGTVTALHPSETELRARKVAYTLINQEGSPDSLIEGFTEVFPELIRAA